MILDDDEEIVELLKSYIEMASGLDIAYAGTDPHKALRQLQTAKVEILFIDMEMPRISGIDFLAQVRERIHGRVPKMPRLKVIVCSAHRDYAADTYGYDVTDYLVKPLNFPRFMEAIDRARNELMVRASATELAGGADLLLLSVDEKKRKRVDYDEIIYLEASDKRCKVWVSETVFYVANRTLKDTLLMLPKHRFERVHRSFAVAYDYIDYIKGNKIKLRHIRKLIVMGDMDVYPRFMDWCATNTI